MQATVVLMLIIAIATSPVVAAITRVHIQSWINACDLSLGDHENCKRYTCLRALKHLVEPETRLAYEHLGMGTNSDLTHYGRLYDYCRLQSRHFSTNKPNRLTQNWSTNLLALRTYRGIHGHTRVPRGFVVSTDDPRWPVETYGMNLGNIVSNLRKRKSALSQNQLDGLEELGFEWGESLDEKWGKNLLALTTFKGIHGHVRVPHRFVVPIDDDLRWPIETHGIKLGNVVRDLRQRKARLSQRRIDTLKELGFEWEASVGDSWMQKLLALTTFEEIHGHMRVPQSFVVPTDDPMWPEKTHGMKLGNIVSNLRLQKDSLPQNQIEALNFFGFEWTVVI